MGKENRITYITVRIIVAIMVLFMLSIGARMFAREFLVGRLDSENPILEVIFFDSETLNTSEEGSTEKRNRSEETVDVDWVSIYPFESSRNDHVVHEKVIELSVVNNLNEKVYAAENKVVAYATHHLVGYKKFIETVNVYKKLIGWDINPPDEYNPVVFIEDDYLGRVYRIFDVTGICERISALKDFTEDSGTEFIFVQPPAKICAEDDESGVIDFSNSNMDDVLEGLEENNVNYMDLRKELHADGKDHHDSFLASDHHWKPETGLWAAGKVAEKLNECVDYNIDTEIFEESHYDKEIYEDNFLGSQGTKVSMSVIGPDDISYLYPKKEVNYTLEIPTIGICETGGFDIIYDFSYLEEQNIYERNSYAVYMHGLRAMSTIKNNNIEDGSKILVISDSFNLTTAPFLAQGVGQVDSILLDYFDGSVYTLIKKGAYDAVIMMYSEMSEFSTGDAFALRFNFK